MTFTGTILLSQINHYGGGLAGKQFISWFTATVCDRKQSSLWAEGDVFRQKIVNEHENGKMAVTRILSGVDDITINGSNKNRGPKKEDVELVSLKITLFPHFQAQSFPRGF